MKALKPKNLIASVAQVLLAFLLLPIVCLVLHWLLPEGELSFLTESMSKLPIIGETLDILNRLRESLQHGYAVSPTGFLNELVSLIGTESMVAIGIGMCVELCHSIGVMLNIRGVPVLQTMVGVMLGVIVVANLRQAGELEFTMTVSFLIIANVVVLIFTAPGQVGKKLLEVFLGFALQSMSAGLASGYAAVLAYIMAGYLTDLLLALQLIWITLTPLVILLALDYFLMKPLRD